MKVHEYQAKQILRNAGVNVPQGEVASTADEAAAAFVRLGGPLAVIKAQIHAGGRGKGSFIEQPSQRGVQLVRSADEAREVAGRMLGNRLVTIQSGPEGRLVHRVLVEAGTSASSSTERPPAPC
jgi:succinyl-CoA synthetase beta subunit